MRRILSIYLISEILPPFLIGLLAFTVILFTARMLKLVELVVTRGLPLLKIGKLFTLILPTFLEMTVPMALLLGILLGLGRLSSDQETTALKASGISPVQILLPIGMLALFISLLSLLITTLVRPVANRTLNKELYNIAKGHVVTALREKVFNDNFPDVLIYVEEVVPPGNASQGILIVDRRDPDRENVIFGKVALFLTDEESRTLNLKIFDGIIHEREKNTSNFSQTHFNVYNVKLDLEEAFSLIRKKERRPKEMSLQQLGRTIRSKEAKGIKPTPEVMELHQRFSFAFAPLVFSLLGVSLAMMPTPSRTGRSWGLASCLFWLLVYYGLLSIGKALGEREIIFPVVALWLPNLVLVLIAAYFFRKAVQESPPLIHGRLGKIFSSMTRRLAPGRRKGF
ncbi:MAG: LPS export ABC transporter permease LptF [Candidatus Binatia bacterium]